MPDTDRTATDDRLGLELEKWKAESAFRRDEIALKKREIELKEQEQQVSRWANPLTVAVAVGAVALVGNVVATWWNGRLQRVLEQDKNDAQQRLDERKAESERILEMIKTGDPAKAATNLRFLLDTGLITVADSVTKLQAYLDRTPAERGPALPAADDRFNIERTRSMTETAAEKLEAELARFVGYLDSIGFPTDTEPARIRVSRLSRPNASYDPNKGLIVIDSRIVRDPYPARREYMHHLLFASKPGYEWKSAVGDIENGLADYFSASFSDDPVLGTQRTAAVFGLGQPYIRRLDHDRGYTVRNAGDEPHQNGETWGGVFWELRQTLGQDLTDRVLVSGWEAMAWPVEESAFVATFVAALLAAIDRVGGQKSVSQARSVLARRNVPLPA